MNKKREKKFAVVARGRGGKATTGEGNNNRWGGGVLLVGQKKEGEKTRGKKRGACPAKNN